MAPEMFPFNTGDAALSVSVAGTMAGNMVGVSHGVCSET
jgi:hypothetical protein